LIEPGPRRLPISTWSQLMVAGNQLRIAGDALQVVDRPDGPASGPAEVVARLVNAAGDLEQATLRAGRSIVEPADPPSPAENSAGSRPDAVGGILPDALPSRSNLADADLDHVITLVWTAEWIDHVGHALDALAAPLAQVQAVAARRWWQ
jgi:hypothetical protein